MFSIVYKVYLPFVAAIFIIPHVVLGAPMRPKTNIAMPAATNKLINKDLQMPGNYFIFNILNPII